MKRTVLAVLAATLAFAAAAQTYPPVTLTLVAVDAVKTRATVDLTLSGVADDGSTLTQKTISFGSNGALRDRCERYALLAMTKPGQYKLVVGGQEYPSSNGSTYVSWNDCSIVRAAP